ncbi:MAG: hypothetical protein Q4F66_08815 [Clostridium sp.]|nr:hypothetical protein [Clostridium sp.]
MECYESNFSYLKSTKLSTYYDDLVRAEYASENFSKVTKIILRRVLEEFLRYMAQENGMNVDIATGVLIKNIKVNKKINLPEEIYEYIQIIRINGVGITLYRSREKNVTKHPIELLELMHRIFCWYLSIEQPEFINNVDNLIFNAPRSMSFESLELKKIQNDIFMKDSQINNLREKIIELGNKSKDISQLNNIIIAIKEEKRGLEAEKDYILKNINMHKSGIRNIQESYELSTKSVERIREECLENHQLLAEKESLLVRCELDNKNMKNHIRQLDEEDSEIISEMQFIDRLLENIREQYKSALNLTNEYQDIIESFEFTDDSGLKRKLVIDKTSVNREFNFQNKIFYSEMEAYNKAIDNLERKVRVFEVILNDKLKAEIRDKEFYKSFLNLKGKQLRLLYCLIKNYSTEYSIIDKSREWMFKYGLADSKFVTDLNKNLKELSTVSDDQIKIILYYKLIKMAGVNNASICNRKKFVQSTDEIIKAAYNMLMPEEDFNYYENKAHSIKIYYLQKLINTLKSRYKNVKIDDALLSKIYTDILEIKSSSEIAFYGNEKIKLLSVNDTELLNSIRKNPFDYLNIIVELGNSREYLDMYRAILEILKHANKDNNVILDNSHIALENFLMGSFRVRLFSSSGAVNFNKKEELIPMIVAEILIGRLDYETQEENIVSYNNMFDIWKRNQSIYNDIFIQKSELEKQLENLNKDKVKQKSELDKIIDEKKKIKLNLKKYTKQFEQLVLTSGKSSVLPSYKVYMEYLNKSKEYGGTKSSKDFRIKSTLSIEAWVDQVSKKINNNNLDEAKSRLINEAKSSEFYKKEYGVVTDLQFKLDEINKDVYNNQKILGEKNKDITEINSRLEDVKKKLKNIKDIYYDMYEDY